MSDCKQCARFQRRYKELTSESFQELKAFNKTVVDRHLQRHRDTRKLAEALTERWVEHIKRDHQKQAVDGKSGPV